MNLIDLRIANQSIDLTPGTAITFEFNNPIFDTELIPGDFSYPFDVPLTPNNQKIFDFPNIIENKNDFKKSIPAQLFIKGILWQEGIIKIRPSSQKKISINFQSAAGSFTDLIKNKTLQDLILGGERNYPTITDIYIAGDEKFYPDSEYVRAVIHNFGFFGQDDLGPPQNGIGNYRLQNWGAGVSNGWHQGLGISETGTIMTFHPYFIYVLQQIFKEHNWKPTGTFLLDPDLQQLFIHSIISLNQPRGATSLSLYLNKALPKIPLSETLNSTKNLFCLGYIFDAVRKTVDIFPLKDILNSSEVEDITRKIISNEIIEQNDSDGFALSYSLDSNDALIENIKSLAGFTIKEPVEEIADLPTTGEADAVLRLVTSLNQYYKATFNVDTEIYEWAFYSDNLFGFTIGNGTQKIESGISTLPMTKIQQLFKTEGVQWLVPDANQKGQQSYFAPEAQDFNLRLLFYRGLQYNSTGGAVAELYPLASSDVFDYAGNKIAKYSLRWDGDEGLYNMWWKPWIDFLSRTKKATYFQLYDVVDLFNISKKWKIFSRIKNSNFLKAKISITITTSEIKPAKVDFYKK